MFSVVKSASPAFPSYQIIKLENKLKEIEFDIYEEWTDKKELIKQLIQYKIVIDIIKSKHSIFTNNY
jgi:hypothetical protein